MSQAPDLSPAQDAVNETENIFFDFAAALAVGEIISSVLSMTCVAVINKNLDATPASRLIGSASIVASPTTNAASAAVKQQVGTCIGGVTYQLQCVVQTSLSQKLECRVNLPCVATPS